MNRLLDLLHSRTDAPLDSNSKTPVSHFGLISCGNRVHIRHVPFDTSCMILVLAGRKLMFENGQTIVCEAGEVLTVPSPGGYDLRNEPDADSGLYRALVIPFSSGTIEQLRRMHSLRQPQAPSQPGILHFDSDPVWIAAAEHYLDCASDEVLLQHRLLELLLILARRDEWLLTYPLSTQSWSQRVNAVLATDLTRSWAMGEVCQRLATSESTLRRQLKNEATSFRDLLAEQRLNAALMQLLQTSRPVTRIAYDCGFQSLSRFSSNFRKRFGLPPSEFRAASTESEQGLTVGGQPGRSRDGILSPPIDH